MIGTHQGGDQPPEEEEMVRSSPRTYWALLRSNRQFAALWVGGMISGCGDYFSLIALVMLTETVSGSALAVSGVLLMSDIAYVVWAVPAGNATDKFDPRTIMIVADLARVLITFGYLLVHTKGMLWMVFVLTFAKESCTAFFQPARLALIPEVVEKDKLLVANSLDSVTTAVTSTLGAGVGGLFTAWAGVSANFMMDAASFMLSAFCLSTLLLCGRRSYRAVAQDESTDGVEVSQSPDEVVGDADKPKASASPSTSGPQPPELPAKSEANELDDIEWETPHARQRRCCGRVVCGSGRPSMAMLGLRYLWQHRDVLYLVLGKAAVNVTLSFNNLANIVIARTYFSLGHKDGGATSLGVVYALEGVSSLLAPMIAQRMAAPTDTGMRVWVGYAFGIVTLGVFATAWSPYAPVWLAGAFAVGFGNSIAYVYVTTLQQKTVEEKFRGRVFASGYAIRTGFSAVGNIMGGLTLDGGVNVRAAMVGVGCYMVALWASWQAYVRAFRRRTALLSTN